MKMTIAVAGGALALVLGAASASADDGGSRGPYHRLPPVAGTIRMAPDGFGSGRLGPVYPPHRHRMAYRLHSYTLAEIAGRRHRFPVAYLLRNGYGQGSVYWNHRVPFYGEGNDTLALTVTGWGTADSATTGGAYPPPSPRYHSSEPVHFLYGTPYIAPPGPLSDAGSTGYVPAGGGYRYPPTGGLAYYNSGSPGSLAYYGSGSSAGPGGTPGGLAIYSSGSYGPGPRVITFDAKGGTQGSRGVGGPHIIHLHDTDGQSPG